jgi:hypothetical protein
MALFNLQCLACTFHIVVDGPKFRQEHSLAVIVVDLTLDPMIVLPSPIVANAKAWCLARRLGLKVAEC